jgi:hypothetical protein
MGYSNHTKYSDGYKQYLWHITNTEPTSTLFKVSARNLEFLIKSYPSWETRGNRFSDFSHSSYLQEFYEENEPYGP